MNLQQLFNEANILNIDTVTAAIEFPLDFKQVIAAEINKTWKVDRIKTFKSPSNRDWEKKQSDWRLYNKYGTAENSSRYSSYNDMGITIYLHQTHDDNQDYIKLYPDTMGNVKVDMSTEAETQAIKIPIQGRTVQQFLSQLTPTLKKLYSGNRNEDSVGKKELADLVADDINKLEYVKSTSVKEPSSRYNERSYRIEVNLDDELLKSSPDYQSEDDFYYKIGRLINDTAYLKTAYKKATGKNPGKKGDNYSLASTIKGYGSSLENRAKISILYPYIKTVTVNVNKIFKKHGIKISSITKSVGRRGFTLIFNIAYGDETYNSRRTGRPVKSQSDFNVFEWLKNNIESDYDKIQEYYRKQFNDDLLPIAQQIVKQLFKDK